ncbi:MAG TPA: xanthine dehydrogenase small subunit [Anaeromyxobacteraceae bacterium]|nr:xanthine dehydrogenase small subunit [Anaeromyxobacteraceae bacterium]
MSKGVRFILDGRVRELEDVDPTLTVLDWLRGPERRCGTKEGCREGDCGACTVVVAELRGGELRYRAVNACILFVPFLDGKALFTVESLCPPGGELHPVQRAMVDCHASQCGFCTPGFVMSLVALYENEAVPSRARVNEVLAGNLCRCTGYHPIAAAAVEAYRGGGGRGLAAHQAALAADLRAIARKDALELEHAGRRYLAPRTVDELARVLAARPGAHVLAGGTDVGLWVTKQHRDLPDLVSILAVEDLSLVARTSTHVEVGAAASYADALAALAEPFPAFGELLRRIGSTQIRNAGTLVGNVANASPIGDTLPALLALSASAVLRRAAGSREVPLDDFFLGYRKTALAPGEFIEKIRIPLLAPGTLFSTYKVSKRFDQDISAVCGAFAVRLEGGRVREARLAYGGMAAVPKRARACEAALVGKPWSEEAVASALPSLDAELSPLSDVRATAGYRRLVARNLLRKFQLETAGPARAVAEAAAGGA